MAITFVEHWTRGTSLVNAFRAAHQQLRRITADEILSQYHSLALHLLQEGYEKELYRLMICQHHFLLSLERHSAARIISHMIDRLSKGEVLAPMNLHCRWTLYL